MRQFSKPFNCLLAVALLIVATPGLSSAKARIESNVVFGMHSGLALLLDVHHPAKANGYGIIVIAGSGFTAPLSADALPLKERGSVRSILAADALLAGGYTLFVINHRASPGFHYPAPVEDVQRAVRFVRHHAARYAIDPKRIGAIGNSSGAQFVSLLGVMDGHGNPDDPSAINRESSKVQAVIAVSAPTDYLANILSGGRFGSSELLGLRLYKRHVQSGYYALETQLVQDISPVAHVSADDAPVLLIHGDADKVVPFRQSELFRDKLEAAGVVVELVRLPGENHNFNEPGDPEISDYFDTMVDWFDRHLVSVDTK